MYIYTYTHIYIHVYYTYTHVYIHIIPGRKKRGGAGSWLKNDAKW